MLTRVSLRKTSLVDFPGRVAAVLFTPGCNFRCPYCHNAALVLPPPGMEDDGLIPLDEAMDLVKARKDRISGVVLSGGEPLLHPELPGIAARIRKMGLAVKLDTNGSFPGGIAEVAADFVALDLKAAPASYGLVAPGLEGGGARVLESLCLLRQGGAGYEVRITCAPGIVDPGSIRGIAAVLEPCDEVVLQAFRPGGCLDGSWDAKEATDPATMAGLLACVREAAPKARIRGFQAG